MKVGVVLAFICYLLLAAVSFAQVQAKIIHAGDKVKVTCKEEQALNNTYTITKDGLIVLPFVGAIVVAGKDETAAAIEISGQLIDQKILSRATVTVQLVESAGGTTTPPPQNQPKKIKIQGAVEATVEVPFVKGLRLSDAVRLVKLKEDAALDQVTITNKAGKEFVITFVNDPNASFDNNPYLAEGDTITIMQQSAPQEIFVLGGVRKPGQFKYVKGMTLQDAVDAAGGYDSLADPRRVRLERNGVGTQVYNLFDEKDPIALKPDDHIVVELSAMRRYLMVLGRVERPGQVEFRDGMTLTQALADAGGINENQGVEKVAVYSGDDAGMKRPVIYNLDKIMRGFSGDVPLNPGDRVEAIGRKQHGPNGLKLFIIAAIILLLTGH